MEVLKKNVKHSSVEVKPDGNLRIVAPPQIDANGIINEKWDWIESKREELKELTKEIRGKEDKFLFHGDFFELYYDNEFHIDLNGKIIYSKNEKHLENKLRENLKKEIRQKVIMFSQFLGVNYGKIFIRKQKSKWASCSSKGNLSFNVKMLALPEKLRDYVVIHELAHLKEKYHTNRFWEIVGTQYPNPLQDKYELKKFWLWIELNNVWKKLDQSNNY